MAGESYYDIIVNGVSSLSAHYAAIPGVVRLFHPAIADFAGNGRQGLFYHLVGDPADGDFGGSTIVGNAANRVIALLPDDDGRLHDVTATLFPDGNVLDGRAMRLAIGDINLDGRPDVAFAAHREDGRSTADIALISASLSVLMSDADGRYHLQQGFPADWYPTVALADISGDGRPDLIASGWQYNKQGFAWDGAAWQSLGGIPGLPNESITVLRPSADSAGRTQFITSEFNADGNVLRLIEHDAQGWHQAWLEDRPDVVYRPWYTWSNTLSTLPTREVDGQIVSQVGNNGLVELRLHRNANPVVVTSIGTLVLDYAPDKLFNGLPYEPNSQATSKLHFYARTGSTMSEIAVPVIGEGRTWDQEFIQALDVNGDGHEDLVVNSRGPFRGTPTFADYKPLVYLNTGNGALARVADAALPDVPTGLALPGARIAASSVFLDTTGDGLPELLYQTGHGYFKAWTSPTSTDPAWTLYRATRPIGNGPGNTDTALSGVPGFNEAFYLREYPDVAALVGQGVHTNGFAHYLAAGRADGRAAHAPGTTVWGLGDAGVVSYGHPLAEYKVARATADALAVADLGPGRDGTDTLHRVHHIEFSDIRLDVEASGGLAISWRDGIGAPPGMAVLAIADAAAQVAEGDEAASGHVFTVTRSGDLGAAAAAVYRVAGNGLRPADAADFADGMLPQGIVAFAPNQTVAEIRIDVAGDMLVEAHEDFVVTLMQGLANVSFSATSAAGRISGDDPIEDLAVADGATGAPLAAAPTLYAGPVSGLVKELILLSPSNLNISVSGPGWFIHSGAGDDAIAVAAGSNVLDGGTGSNFLTGASGLDIFFVDARDAPAPIWSTVNGFAKGDAVTVWGISQDNFALDWLDGQGAPGFTGLTLHASAPGRPIASLTLAGFSNAQMQDGSLAVLAGRDDASGSDYVHIVAI